MLCVMRPRVHTDCCLLHRRVAAHLCCRCCTPLHASRTPCPAAPRLQWWYFFLTYTLSLTLFTFFGQVRSTFRSLIVVAGSRPCRAAEQAHIDCAADLIAPACRASCCAFCDRLAAQSTSRCIPLTLLTEQAQVMVVVTPSLLLAQLLTGFTSMMWFMCAWFRLFLESCCAVLLALWACTCCHVCCRPGCFNPSRRRC